MRRRLRPMARGKRQITRPSPLCIFVSHSKNSRKHDVRSHARAWHPRAPPHLAFDSVAASGGRRRPCRSGPLPPGTPAHPMAPQAPSPCPFLVAPAGARHTGTFGRRGKPNVPRRPARSAAWLDACVRRNGPNWARKDPSMDKKSNLHAAFGCAPFALPHNACSGAWANSRAIGTRLFLRANQASHPRTAASGPKATMPPMCPPAGMPAAGPVLVSAGRATRTTAMTPRSP